MGLCLAKDQDKDDDSDHHVDMVSGNVQLITTKESWDQKLQESSKDHKILIANFSAAWCGPCKLIAPYYCELSEKYSSMIFLLVDVDELTDFSTSLDIRATPTFFFFRDGQQIDKLVGANKPELAKKVALFSTSFGSSIPNYQ
ncbi:thioredoxin H-type [Arachis duranensis]|uniref:Thioredoxin H-type n=1 Tax=Arachis duranensis TaxID=130453 RepID=A0A6P4C8Y7_ARADU|nr:thioredoxin H-type [Arachis duranensis]XP_057741932.1 thioredoxin H-type-like [Arachis stenosperma]